jgi:hypothetical protein
LEVDQESLIADEDKIWSAIQSDYAFANLGFEDGDEAELVSMFEEGLQKHESLFKRIMSDLQIDDVEENFDSFIKGLRAFILRAYSWEWCEEANKQEFEDINKICDLARSTVSHDWMSRQFSEYAITCRSLSSVSPDPNSGENKIVGAICLRMNSDGLKIGEVEAYGSVTKKDINDFVSNFKSAVRNISGSRVSGGTGKVSIQEYTHEYGQLIL